MLCRKMDPVEWAREDMQGVENLMAEPISPPEQARRCRDLWRHLVGIVDDGEEAPVPQTTDYTAILAKLKKK